ncbi:MAG: sugar ABC transporter ATP-binding protein [Solirubrobacteraceae bacterium]|nr:sugar ABC transporter ATP-binding protein [Solirubrobacteraceae bacterium]
MNTARTEQPGRGPGVAEAPAAPLLRVANVAKAFGPTQAVRDASFELRAGEVLALVGENGCGKSTMVKILSGVHQPDAGTIELEGEVIEPMATPHQAQQRGIFTVFQEVLVAETCSVLDNVWLGVDGTWRTRVPMREKRARARELLTRLLGREIDLGTAVEELSLSDRQACGIVRALLRDPKVLILDEATSALDVATRDRLFEIVGELSRQGVGVIFITHRMDEIERIGDRITVMRSGVTVGELGRGQWTTRQLVQLMTGEDGLASEERARLSSVDSRRGDVVLSVRGLKLRPDGRPIDLEVRAGELIGLAGLEGHGGHTFLEALRGGVVTEGQVVRHVAGQEVVIGSPSHAADNDIAYVPRERRLDAIFSWMSIRENFALPTMARDSRAGWLSLRSARRRLAAYKERLGIVLGSPEDSIMTLSGGNQQKVIIARWLAYGPRVLLLNDPTRGIDIGAKRDLYALFGALAAEGLAVVMLSTELDEHVELMDRVLVFREHELFREFERSEVTRERLVAAFFGEEDED